MFERFKRALPQYFVDKFAGEDEKQVNTLPVSIRKALIHGTEEEFIQALDGIRARERLQGKTLLGEAGMEMIVEMRGIL